MTYKSVVHQSSSARIKSSLHYLKVCTLTYKMLHIFQNTLRIHTFGEVISKSVHRKPENTDLRTKLPYNMQVTNMLTMSWS